MVESEGFGAAQLKQLLSSRRTIIHLDLDAFYAQVEMVRLNTPRDEPLAVQQWRGLIAVNYRTYVV
jgi:hypothetical protein